MTANSDVSVGLAHKLCNAAVAQGYTPDLLNALAESPGLFGQLLTVQLGQAEVKFPEHIIDCDADPFVPDGWRVEEHRKGGQFKFDPKAVRFYLSERQHQEEPIVGNVLREELADKPVLNANVLDYLLAHQYLIPGRWKRDEMGRARTPFFWGTIYRGPEGGSFVRCLCVDIGKWYWRHVWLGCHWDAYGPAAMRAD